MNIFLLTNKELKLAAAKLEKERRKWPMRMRKLTAKETPEGRPQMMKEAWRGKEFLAQVYNTISPNITRISVNRTIVDVPNRRWKDGITWDELMDIKSQLGYAEKDAVEVLPADKDVVNVANMRHIFVFEKDSPLDFIWRGN